MRTECPVCGETDTSSILELRDIPVFCNVQLESRSEALSQPTGDMVFTSCIHCGHFFNAAFDESLLSYDTSYENSLHFSPTFNQFAAGLVERLVKQYALHNKRVLDIGCGKGDFLGMLCDAGANHGFGFDLSVEADRAVHPENGSVQYFKEYFSDRHADLQPDLVTCRHVLEHIYDPATFLRNLEGSLQSSQSCAVYFEVPNAFFTIRDLGIWDLIYEHCQYFTPNSFAHAFVRADFEVQSVYECFGQQFLGLDGQLKGGQVAESCLDQTEMGPGLTASIATFGDRFRQSTRDWHDRVASLSGEVVIWGGGSKGVTFLNMLELGDEISCVVDINPHKQGKFIPVTGHELVSPEQLADIRPDHILLMNPLYAAEVGKSIEQLEINVNLIPVL